MIKIYKGEFCNNCTLVSQYLKNNGVELEEIMITDNISQTLAANGFTMLPVLEVNGELRSKLSKDDLDEIIKQEKEKK